MSVGPPPGGRSPWGWESFKGRRGKQDSCNSGSGERPSHDLPFPFDPRTLGTLVPQGPWFPSGIDYIKKGRINAEFFPFFISFQIYQGEFNTYS